MKSITTANIKIPKIKDFDNEYIENYLKKSGYDVIRWAITDISNSEINVSFSFAE